MDVHMEDVEAPTTGSNLPAGNLNTTTDSQGQPANAQPTLTPTKDAIEDSSGVIPADNQAAQPLASAGTESELHQSVTKNDSAVDESKEEKSPMDVDPTYLTNTTNKDVPLPATAPEDTSAAALSGSAITTAGLEAALGHDTATDIPAAIASTPPTINVTDVARATDASEVDSSKQVPPASTNFDSAHSPQRPEKTPSSTPSPVPPTPATRAYVPQFKFTTFAPMTPLPIRNVTSNFLKTEKNFVLKEKAGTGDKDRRKAQRKNRKRKTGEQDMDDEQAKEEGDKSAEEQEEKDSTGVAAKKTKTNTEEESGSPAEDMEVGGNEDSSDDSSSDSDSEESVVNETDETGEDKQPSDSGKRIIVIHPGSRVLRIGRASDAYPVVTPHVIARRMRAPTQSSTSTATSGANKVEDDASMDVDVDAAQEDTVDVVNDRYLAEIEYDLKQRMKAAKRRPVPNAKSQVRSFNTSSRPEKILDHNDPYKVEWTDPAIEGEYIIGQKALNLPPSKNHTFKMFWPVQGGKFNEQDYASPRVVVADLETIWTKVIKDELEIDPKKFRKHYALLIIPDLYSKLYVTELVGMLLKSMQFKGVMVQQESVCASFGAGVSAACVVDIGAEVTKVGCVEDGICIPNSRAVLKYGGDDITRCFAALVNRTGFPYADMDLSQSYDWRLMEELKEKWCTMNEADLTVQVYSFFVRKPDHQTEKYHLKVYDEVALSPMCLFFPGVIRRWIEQREVDPSFARLMNYEDINEDAPAISLTNQASKKNTAAAAAAVAAAARAGTPTSVAAGEDGTPQPTPAVGTPNNAVVGSTSGGATPAATAAPTPAPTPAVIPFAMEPSVTTTDVPWEIAGTIGKDHFSSLVSLDVVVAQCISNCGSEERSKKLYGSIILVGGGGMITGFDRVLEDRLFQALPATLTTVEKVEVLPSPREMDPRLLVWKGGSVLGKLDMSKELWIKPLEWELLGRKILRDRALFVWSKD